MQMLVSVLSATVLLIATVWLHSAGLSYLRSRVFGQVKPRRHGPIIAVWSVVGLHLAEIVLYGVVLWFLHVVVKVGMFGGNREFNPIDYFYYSAETFTALGSGDMTVTAGLRLVSAMEALNGLVLIAWSGAFTYWVMEHRWNGANGEKPDGGPGER